MKKLLLVPLLYLLTLNLGFGQKNTKTIGEKRTLYGQNTAVTQSINKPAVESPYFGYDNKIKEISISNSIPTNFPTKENYTSKEQYRIAINKWIKENPSFIKPEFKNTIIND
jgi:hypothetical protein